MNSNDGFKLLSSSEKTIDYINKQLSASYVKDDTFVPIKKVSASNNELKDKLFSNEEYISIIKDLADMYGDRLSEIINTNSKSFNVSDLDSLLSLDDPKYSEIYKSILEK